MQVLVIFILSELKDLLEVRVTTVLVFSVSWTNIFTSREEIRGVCGNMVWTTSPSFPWGPHSHIEMHSRGFLPQLPCVTRTLVTLCVAPCLQQGDKDSGSAGPER